MPLRVLHIFKQSYRNPTHRYLGSVKDIRSRTAYFQERGIEYEELLVSGKTNYREAIINLFPRPSNKFDAVLLEMTFSPAALKTLRRRLPAAILLVRSHNAELIHRVHWARAQGASWTAMRFLAQSLKNGAADVCSGWRSDYILPITSWEADVYWSRLIPAERIKYVPFYLAEPYASELKKPEPKTNLCVHLGSSLNNPMITDATRNFIRAVENLGDQTTDWEFMVTGALPERGVKIPGGIRYAGVLADPYAALRPAKAMALLSNYGMGFKTKILEAVMTRTFVIMPEGLYARQPPELVPYCIPVRLNSSKSFLEALEKCSAPFPEGDPNMQLRRQAFEAMDQLFFPPCPRKTCG